MIIERLFDFRNVVFKIQDAKTARDRASARRSISFLRLADVGSHHLRCFLFQSGQDYTDRNILRVLKPFGDDEIDSSSQSEIRPPEGQVKENVAHIAGRKNIWTDGII